MRVSLPNSVTARFHLAALFIATCGMIWFAMEITAARRSAKDSRSKSTLSYLTCALSNYEYVNGHLPALRSGDEPVVKNWRAEIVNFIKETFPPYYSEQPWNSAGNIESARSAKPMFQNESFNAPADLSTQVLAVDYPESPWRDFAREDAKDRPLLVFDPDSKVGIFEPRDITLSELRIVMAHRPTRAGQRVYVISFSNKIRELTAENFDEVFPQK